MDKIGEKLRIMLIVPKLVRDLEGHALVAYHLEHQFGHNVLLHTGSETEQVLLDYEPDALVIDWVGYGDRLIEAHLAKAVGAKLCVLPTAGVFPDEGGFLRGAGQANGGNRLVDSYLSWGEFAAEAIVRRKVLPRSCVEVTGCARFDFYADEKLAGIGKRLDFLRRMGRLNPSSPVILWCTGTNNFNNLDRNPERYIRALLVAGGVSESHLRMEIEDEKKQLQAHSQVVLELARRHPEWNVLVKVHPLEDRNFYFQWARESPNIFIAPNVPIREFVFHCDVLLQRGCTTATEFWTRQKPVLELRMGEFSLEWAPPEHTACNYSVHTTDETDGTIGSYLAGRAIPASQKAARERYIRRFYYRVDGLSSLRCAQRIHSEVSPPSYTREDRSCKQAIIAQMRLKKREEVRRNPVLNLKRMFGVPRHRTLRPWKRSFWSAPPAISPQTLAQLYEKYDYAMMETSAAVPQDFKQW